jgi:hypothetical protein
MLVHHHARKTLTQKFRRKSKISKLLRAFDAKASLHAKPLPKSLEGFPKFDRIKRFLRKPFSKKG